MFRRSHGNWRRVALLGAATALLTAAPAWAQSTTPAEQLCSANARKDTTLTFDNQSVTVPAGQGGALAGQTFTLNGSIQVRLTVRRTGNDGGCIVLMHADTRNLTIRGAGANAQTWRASGILNAQARLRSSDASALTGHAVLNVRFTGSETASRLRLHVNTRVTLDPNGQLAITIADIILQATGG